MKANAGSPPARCSGSLPIVAIRLHCPVCAAKELPSCLGQSSCLSNLFCLWWGAGSGRWLPKKWKLLTRAVRRQGQSPSTATGGVPRWVCTVTDGYVTKTSILVVDHDAAIVESVATVLRQEGFEVHVALDGYAGLQKTRAGSFELVVFDVTLPDLGGLEIARRIRAEGIDVPILFLTARSGAEGRVAGLTIWGDDYLSKPFSLVEIVAADR